MMKIASVLVGFSIALIAVLQFTGIVDVYKSVASSAPIGRVAERSIFNRNDFATQPASNIREATVTRCLCRNKSTEVNTPLGRADCVGDVYAVEVERADKWHDAIGQSLSYAKAMSRKPMIYLYCPASESDAKCFESSEKLNTVIREFSLPIKFREFREREVLANPQCARNESASARRAILAADLPKAD